MASEECIICSCPMFKEHPYGMIDQEANRKYHIECLNEWFHKSKIGIISLDPVQSYTIYQNGIFIEQIDVNNPYRIQPYIPPTPDVHVGVDMNMNMGIDVSGNENKNSNTNTNTQHTETHPASSTVVWYICVIVCLLNICILIYPIFKLL